MTRRAVIVPAVVAGAVAAMLAVVLLPGSSRVQVDIGPLGGGPVNGAECGPGPTVVIGLDEFQNSTGSPIRVEKFRLVDPHGLKLLGVDLVPGSGVGLGAPYPPSPTPSSSRTWIPGWRSRRALPLTMEPSPTRWFLVYGLEVTAKTGTLSYAELSYEYRGVQYLFTSQTAVEVVPSMAATSKCYALPRPR